MKLLLIGLLTLITTYNAYAVEFSSCKDNKGQLHFTNLPATSLSSDCSHKNDQYAIMLNEDYANLVYEFEKYKNTAELDEQNNNQLTQIESFINSAKELMNPDIALDQLLETSSKTEDSLPGTFFNVRSKAVESILSEGKRDNPPQ